MNKQKDVCACNDILFSLINSAHDLGSWPSGLEFLLHPRKKDWHGHVHDCNPSTMRKGGTSETRPKPQVWSETMAQRNTQRVIGHMASSSL